MYVRDAFVQSLLPTNSGWFAQADIARDGHHRQPAGAQRASLRGRHAGGGQLLCRRRRASRFCWASAHRPSRERVHALTRRCMQRLEEIGWPSVTPVRDERRGATVAVPSRDSAQLCARADEARHRHLVSR